MLHVLMQFIDKILTFMREVTDIYTRVSSASTIGCQCRPSVSKTKYFISGRWCSKIHQGWFRLHIPSIRAFQAIHSREAIDNNRLASSEGPAKNRSLHKTKAWLIIAAQSNQCRTQAVPESIRYCFLRPIQATAGISVMKCMASLQVFDIHSIVPCCLAQSSRLLISVVRLFNFLIDEGQEKKNPAEKPVAERIGVLCWLG